MRRLSVNIGRFHHGHTHTGVFRRPELRICTCERAFASRPERDESQTRKGPVIKWFEQLFPGARRTPAADQNGGEFAEEAQALKRRIDQLGAEVADLRGDNKPSLIEPLIASLSEEDQAKVRKALAESDDQGEDGLDPFEQDISLVDLPKLSRLGPRLEFSSQQVVILENLDKRLREAADDITSAGSRRASWKAYVTAKRNLPPFLRHVPENTFRVLWESQNSASVSDPRRAGHLCTLGADMASNGKELRNEWALLYIDSLLREGRLQDAQLQWESYEARLARKEETRLEYGYLGLRVFADMGNPARAQEIALELIPDAEKDAVSPILIPVILAWVKLGDEQSIKNAWALYLRLRKRLGSEIRVRDYDYLTKGFLETGRTDLALAVFKDLMLTGKDHEYTSEGLYKASLGLVGRLQDQSVDTSELNNVSLTALLVMPRQFQNKYFYGSWMKHLLGNGETDAAASVVELMIERGVKPDSRHLNGIIGAWLRGDNAEDRAKAEQMAWAMIHQRLDLVRERQGQHVRKDTQIDEVANPQVARYLRRRQLAPATIETFSLLLLDYERRSVHKQADVLKIYFSKAQITPNSYWINHLMYAELRRGHHERAWKIYIKRPGPVSPDLETFACLWDCEKRHLDRLAVYPQDSFPNPRLILRDMFAWYSSLGPALRKETCEEATRELYDQILRCLCLSRDLEGTIVAMYALKELFGFYPDQDTARLITLQVARVGTGGDRSGKRRRRTLSAHGQSKDAVAKMKQVLDLVTEQRADKIREQGIDPMEWDDEKKGQELIIVLASFLQTVMREKDGTLGIAKKIKRAFLESGAPSMHRELEFIPE